MKAKKLIVYLCALLMLELPLFASSIEQQDDSDLMSAAELTLQLDLEEFNVDEELDAESAEEAEMMMEAMRPPRRGERPPRYRPRPPRHRPRPRPPRYTEIMCVARNGRGDIFRAYDYRAFRAENKALRRCERNSYRPRSCYVQGCRVTGGRYYP